MDVAVISGITSSTSTIFPLDESTWVGTPVDLYIAWLNGRLIVEVNGGPPAFVNYSWPISALALIASSGRCRFSDLSLGNIRRN